MAINFLDGITVDGDVGIGTASPSALLHVVGTSGKALKTSGDISFTAYTGDTKIDMANNVLQLLSPSGNVQIGDTEGDGNGTSIKVDDANSKTVIQGNVGIGTTSPSEKLEVVGDIKVNDSLNPNIRFARGASYWWDIGHTASDFQLESATGGVIMHLNYNGNVGIGTTAPAEKLDVSGNINATGTMECTKFVANANSGFEFSIEGDNQFNMIQTAANRSMFFVTAAGSGSINFGTNNTNSRVSITSTGALKSTISLAVGAITPSTTVGRIDAANDIVAFSTSDIRLKDNIKSIDKALDKVNSIQGIEFDWIEKEEVHGNSGHDIGVIAQEIEKILPDVVTTRDNGYKAVKYEKIVPLLIEAIKDLSKQVDGLKRLI